MEITSAHRLPVLGPQVDLTFWQQVFAAGQGGVTGVPAETMAVLQLRSLPAPVVVANGRNYNPIGDNPAILVPGR